MVEVFVLFLFGVILQFPTFYSHPLILGMSILLVGVFMSCLFILCGPLFSFSAFMVMVGGVLVVFSYTISLVPFKGLSKTYEESGGSNGPGEQGWNAFYSIGIFTSLSVGVPGSGLFYVSLVMDFLVALIIGYFQGEDTGEVDEFYYFFSDSAYFSQDYSFVLVWLSALLFVAMIFSMSLANRYEGALVK